MPTVLRKEGFDVMIYTADHEPKHVHVFKGGAEVIINIANQSVRANRGMRAADVAHAQDIVADNSAFLESEWDRIKPVP